MSGIEVGSPRSSSKGSTTSNPRQRTTYRRLKSLFWLTSGDGPMETKGTDAEANELFGRGWIRARHAKGVLAFEFEHTTADIVNSISAFLHANPSASKTARLIVRRPQRRQVTWPAAALSRTRFASSSPAVWGQLREQARYVLPECKPRKGRKRSAFFDRTIQWIEQHRFFRDPADPQLDNDSGLAYEAAVARLPRGLRLKGFPVATKRGLIVRLSCNRNMSWTRFENCLPRYLSKFGHSGFNGWEILVERDFIRMLFVTASKGKPSCIHVGEIQVDGTGTTRMIAKARGSRA